MKFLLVAKVKLCYTVKVLPMVKVKFSLCESEVVLCTVKFLPTAKVAESFNPCAALLRFA